MRIAFIWQGFDGRYGHWNDGLKAALGLIEKEHDVRYFDFPLTGIHEFKPDVVLYWESAITLRGKDAHNYQSVIDLPYKKALLFAGGPVEMQLCYGFDLYFVESKINEEEFNAIGRPWKRAFGVNTEVFKPEKQPKVFDGIHHATCAGWKRLDLFSSALRDKGIVCGRFQETDPQPYLKCRENGTLLLPEQSAEGVSSLLNASLAIVNTSEYWGGGQRAVLEGLAVGIPAIVMKDSPKNSEYIEESGAGLIVEPTEHAIREAIEDIRTWPKERYESGLPYIQSKYTEKHYADALLEGIKEICG